MPTNLRFSKKEEELLRKKCVEINKILVSREKAPLKESEVAHFLLENSIPYLKVNRDGELEIDA